MLQIWMKRHGDRSESYPGCRDGMKRSVPVPGHSDAAIRRRPGCPMKFSTFTFLRPRTAAPQPGVFTQALSPILSCALVLLMVAGSHAQTDIAPSTVSAESGELTVTPFHQVRERQEASERQEQFRMNIAIPDDAVGDDAAEAFAARHEPIRKIKPPAPPPAIEPPSVLQLVILLVAAVLLVVLLLLHKFAPKWIRNFKPKLNPLASVPSGSEPVLEKFRVEEEGVTAFFTAFQAGPPATFREASPDTQSETSVIPGEFTRNSSPVERVELEESQVRVAKLLVTQRSLLQEINRASEPEGRHKMLAALRWEMHTLKSEAWQPRLLPVWQVASALEALLKQLMDKPANITPYTLRTIAGGVELLEQLGLTGVNPSVLTTQPVRVLVVDDNLISRNALVRALKRAFNPPDLAEDTETALVLGTKQSYDVIFLDVQMPGVDGHQFCSRIHDTIPNRTTPVVFVTDQSDFDMRAKSTLSAGSDLICKPFLTFEVTVKALTCALRGRLDAKETVMA
jgi:CheY-like chemotaxis protein